MLIIHREAPKAQLVTMGQANKEIKTMADKPKADYYPPGATEPIVRPANIPDPAAKAGVETISEESASKGGPVGAKGEPRKAETTKTSKK